MRWKRTLQLLDVHCEGEIGRVATGGVPKIPGATVAEQLNWLNTDPKGEELRRFLTLEPRGTPIGSVNLLLPPKHPDADAAFVILQPDQAHASSGSNSICATTALLESGMVEMKEPETIVMLETAAGLVKATATCKDGRCEKVKLTMVPSFVHELDVEIDTPDWGRIHMDISYGGIFYALVDVRQIGLTIDKANAAKLVAAGMVLKDIVNRDILSCIRKSPRSLAWPMSCSAIRKRMAPSAPAPPCGRAAPIVRPVAPATPPIWRRSMRAAR